jgi:hypothetical protein
MKRTIVAVALLWVSLCPLAAHDRSALIERMIINDAALEKAKLSAILIVDYMSKKQPDVHPDLFARARFDISSRTKLAWVYDFYDKFLDDEDVKQLSVLFLSEKHESAWRYIGEQLKKKERRFAEIVVSANEAYGARTVAEVLAVFRSDSAKKYARLAEEFKRATYKNSVELAQETLRRTQKKMLEELGVSIPPDPGQTSGLPAQESRQP